VAIDRSTGEWFSGPAFNWGGVVCWAQSAVVAIFTNPVLALVVAVELANINREATEKSRLPQFVRLVRNIQRVDELVEIVVV